MLNKTKRIRELIKAVNILHERLKVLEENRPYKLDVDNVTMQYLDELINQRKSQISTLKEFLITHSQSQLSALGIRQEIDNKISELSRLLVIKSAKERQNLENQGGTNE